MGEVQNTGLKELGSIWHAHAYREQHCQDVVEVVKNSPRPTEKMNGLYGRIETLDYNSISVLPDVNADTDRAPWDADISLNAIKMELEWTFCCHSVILKSG